MPLLSPIPPGRIFVAACVFSTALISTALSTPPPRTWGPNPFTPLTPARIAALPDVERSTWESYWNASEALATKLPERPHPDISPLKPMSGPPKGGIHTKGLRLDAPEAWYASDDARAVASRVAAAQMPIGAWPKGEDYTRDGGHVDPHSWGSGTFDNDATTSELTYLAHVIAGGPADARATAWRAAFERGMAYIFAAQYPNGGFPQVYPLIGGYHDAVTFNDDAVINILEVLRATAGGDGAFAFVPPAMRAEAAARLQRGIRCILATQSRDAAGRLTVWCQQCDALTLQPCAARNFEPIADCSRESASITLFQMSLPAPSPEIVRSVDAAVAWYRRTALKDLKVRRAPADGRGDAVPSPGAPPLWARFYEPGTLTPIFGDRDRTIHYDLKEVSAERIAGYTWFTDAPRRVLKQYDIWRKNLPVAKTD